MALVLGKDALVDQNYYSDTIISFPKKSVVYLKVYRTDCSYKIKTYKCTQGITLNIFSITLSIYNDGRLWITQTFI